MDTIEKFLVLLLLVLLTASDNDVEAQGCSDAGVCNMGSLGSGGQDTSSRDFTVVQSIGWGEQHTLIHISQVDGSLRVLPRLRLGAKVPFQFVTGNLGTSADFGDILVNTGYTLVRGHSGNLIISVGMRLPLNNSDLEVDQRSLPMPYQSSLGTVDMLFGLNYHFDDWHFAAGYQHPFGSNGNSFLRENWQDDEDASKYFESNRFRRGDDVILRIEKRVRRPKNSLYFGILPIYRLQKDRIEKGGELIDLNNSDGLTLNINFTWEKKLSKKRTLRLSYGSPVIWRKTRADGLTRVAVLTASLNFGQR